ncbi:MAG: site-2 protease family protein [Clostridiaceae bacterium]
MKNSFRIGKVKGIEIEVNISWFIVFVLVTYMLATSYFTEIYPDWGPALRWTLGSIMALLLFSSVLLHELSHSLVSIHSGINVSKISLFIFGGIAQMDEEPDEPKKELKIAIAGPAMSLCLSLLFVILTYIFNFVNAPAPVTVVFNYVYSINLILALFNLVPAFPMDGGRILRALIWRHTGKLHSATKVASSLGGKFGYFLILIGIILVLSGNYINGIWLGFIGWFIHQASKSSYKTTVLSDIFNKIPIREFMTENVIAVENNISVRELVDKYFYKYKFPSFPVKMNEEIMGIVTTESIKKIPVESWDQITVASIITPLDADLIVSPDDIVSDVMAKLFTNTIGRVLVMDEGRLTGIVSRTDILNYIRIHSQLEQ